MRNLKRLSAPPLVAVLACLYVVPSGCGPSQPEVIPVSGSVYYQGKPVEGALVSFMPKGGRPASGQTDAAGRFQLMTFKPGDGAVPGEHNVAVSKMVESGKQQGGYAVMANKLPEKYQSPATSGLAVTIKAGEPNDIKLELK